MPTMLALKPVAAATQWLYEYSVLEYRVIDADTLKFMIDVGWGARLEMSCRVAGVDVPESNTSAGKHVTKCVEKWMAQWTGVTTKSVEKDKYAGRYVGLVHGYSPTVHRVSLTVFLLTNKLAREYKGGTKPPWTVDELTGVYSRAEVILRTLATQQGY